MQISAGIDHSLFVAEDSNGERSLYSCGSATEGASGLTKTLKGMFSTPQKVTAIDKERKIEGNSELADFIEIKACSKTSFVIIENPDV